MNRDAPQLCWIFLNGFIRSHWAMRQQHTKANQNNSLHSTISAIQLKYAKCVYEWWTSMCNGIDCTLRWYTMIFSEFQNIPNSFLTHNPNCGYALIADIVSLFTFQVLITRIQYPVYIILFEHGKCSAGSYNPSIFNRP